MNKLLPALALAAAPFLFAFNPVAPVQKPKASPTATVSYAKDGLKIEVNYSRPSKKGRVIFGGLVPFDQVWMQCPPAWAHCPPEKAYRHLVR